MPYFTTGLETLTEKIALPTARVVKLPRRPASGAQKARGGIGRTLKRVGIGAGIGLGAAGLGTAWALKKEQDRDKDQRGLAYAPMSGI